MPKKSRIPKPVKFITITNDKRFENSTCAVDNVNIDDDIESSTVSAESWGSSSVEDSSDDDECSSSDDLLSFVSKTSESLKRDAMYLPTQFSSYVSEKEKLRPYSHGYLPECDRSSSISGQREGNTDRYRIGKGYPDSLFLTKSLTSDLSAASLTRPINTLPSDLTIASQSCVSSVPTAVTFANECLERSNMRRSTTSNTLPSLITSHTLPSLLTIGIRPRTQSLNEELTVTSLSADLHEPVSTSASSNSNTSSMTLGDLSKISDLTTANIAMIEDYEHSPRGVRVINIKRQMRSQEIQYYRSKCVRSLRRSMALSTKIMISDDDESSTTSLELTRLVEQSSNEKSSNEKHDGVNPTTRHAQSAMDVLRDIVVFNIILAIMYMFYFLYKDSIMDAIQRIDKFRLVGVSS